MKLALTSAQIWMHYEAVDFRLSINGLSAIVCSIFSDPLKDSLFVFFNRSRDKLKILAWHGNGFVLLYKRLERGRFTIDTQANEHYTLNEDQLSWLLAGLNWHEMSHWKELKFSHII